MHAHCRMQLMIEVGLWRTWATHFYAADGENLDMPEMHFEMQSNMDGALLPSPAATDADDNQSLSVDKVTAVLAALRPERPLGQSMPRARSCRTPIAWKTLSPSAPCHCS